MGKWLKSPTAILFEVRDHIAYVTLNGPEKRNAMSFTAMQEVKAAMMEADDLKSVRVVVLSGNGKDFCAGAISPAVRSIPSASDYDPAEYRERDSKLRG